MIRARFLDRTTPPHIATLVLMAALPALTMNIILPSLPSMARHFNVPYGVMQLAVSLYLVTNAIVQLLIGPIADRYGRRHVMMATTCVFLLGTAGAMIATDAHVFLLMRMLQAVSAAGMVMSRAIVRDMYPPDRSASMIGYVTMGMSLAPMIAPTVGGMIDQLFGWQTNLRLQAVAGCGLLLLIFFDQGETSERHEASLMRQFGQFPILFHSRDFWAYCLAATFSSAGFFAFLGGAPFVASEIFHLTPLQLGIGFVLPALGYAVGNFITGRLSYRLGLNRMLYVGSIISIAALVVLVGLGFVGLDNPLIFFPCLGVMGIGNGMVMPNANAGMLSVRPELAGTAAGLGGAMTLGSGAAIAVLSGLVLHPEGSSVPLVMIMLITAVFCLFCVQDIKRRS